MSNKKGKYEYPNNSIHMNNYIHNRWTADWLFNKGRCETLVKKSSDTLLLELLCLQKISFFQWPGQHTGFVNTQESSLELVKTAKQMSGCNFWQNRLMTFFSWSERILVAKTIGMDDCEIISGPDILLRSSSTKPHTCICALKVFHYIFHYIVHLIYMTATVRWLIL